MEQARAHGVVSPLGQLILLDTAVQHGTDADPDGLPTLITQTDEAHGSGPNGDETAWLDEFLEVRRAHLLDPDDQATAEVWRKSVPRVDTLKTLLDEGRFDLETPLTWTFAGQRFRVDPG
jgi:chitosanase